MTELRKQINNIVEDHQACLTLAKSMNGNEVYEGTTATAEDIALGKTAYVNGEKVTGELEIDNNTSIYTSLQPGTQSGNRLAYLIKKLPSNLTVTKNVQGKYVADYAFMGASNLEELEFDMSKITDANCMINSCTNLKKVKLTDTSNVTDFFRFAYGCTKLEDIDINSFASATDINGMFTNCTSLSDESLNNILNACITKPSPSTLSGLGLTEEQATRCQSLSNYEAFTAAGWTTGY